MLSLSDLRQISGARLKDAEVLRAHRRYDGAVYLCGYAVEIALKAQVCIVQSWLGFPVTSGEFEGKKKFKIHDFDRLLAFSGAELEIKTKHFAAWSTVLAWDPSVRYRPIGTASAREAREMIGSTRELVKALR